jgi:hypothetical protein
VKTQKIIPQINVSLRFPEPHGNYMSFRNCDWSRELHNLARTEGLSEPKGD